MEVKKLIMEWFEKWENAQYESLPITENYIHISPFGKIETKAVYLEMVQSNKDKFLGYKFQIHDLICEENRACVRYSAKQDEFELEVSEWHYCENGLINNTISYYHIGEIKEERQLK